MTSSNHVGCIGETRLLEPEINHLASDYIRDNYRACLCKIEQMGIDFEKSSDLLHDVFASILSAENNGESYDSAKGFVSDYITVEQFVLGRIKGYSKNWKYRKDIVQSMSKKAFAVASSSSTEEIDDMSSMQKAYAMATSFDDSIEEAENCASLRDSICICMEFEDRVGMSILALLRNIDVVMTANSSLLVKLREAVKYHTDFGDALQLVLGVANTNKPVFEKVLATF